MKKALISISALTLSVAPVTGFLYTTKTQVTNEITKEIKQAMEDTSLMFKQPILSRSTKMNSGVVSKVLNDNDTKVSDVSSIKSNLSLKEYNKQTYDYMNAEKYIAKVNKTSGYIHLDDKAGKETLYEKVSNLSSAAKSIYSEDGLNPKPTNELLNMISYIGAGANLAITPSKLNDPIAKIGPKISFLTNLPDAPSYDELVNKYGIETFGDMHNVILIQFGNLIAKFLTKTEEGQVDYKLIKDKARNSGLSEERASANAMKELYDVLYNAMYNKFAKIDLKKFVTKTNLGDIADNSPETILAAILKQNTTATAEMFTVTDISKSWGSWSATLKPTANYINNIKVTFKPKKTSKSLLMNDKYLASAESSKKIDIKGVIDLIYIISWYISSFDEYQNEFIKKGENIDLFDPNIKNMDIISTHKLKKIEYSNVQDKSLKGFFSIFKAIFVNDNTLSSTRALKILFQVDDDYEPSFDKMGMSVGFFSVYFNGVWTKKHYESPDNVKNGFAILFQPLVEGLLMSDTVQKELQSVPVVTVKLEGAGNGFGALLSSLLANNDNTAFFKDGLTSGLIGTILGWIGSVKPYIDGIVNSAKAGAFNKMMTQLFFSNIKSDFIEKLKPMLTGFGIAIPENIPDINISEVMNRKLGPLTIGSAIWMIIPNIVPVYMSIKPFADTINSIFSDSAINKYNFYDQKTKKEIAQEDIASKILGYTTEQVTPDYISDLALVFGMMKFNGFGKTIGIRLKDDSTGNIIYGPKAWKLILGYRYDEKYFEDKSLLGNLNKVMQNKIVYTLIDIPVTFFDDTVKNTLSQIRYDKKRLVRLRSDKSRFENKFISYKSQNNQNILEYTISYKISQGVYDNYRVIVIQDNTTKKWSINNFSYIKQ